MLTMNSLRALVLALAALGPMAAEAQDIGSGIYNKWQAVGGAGGFLGNARSGEAEAGRSPAGTTGRYALFNGGVILWHSNGSRAYTAYEVHGAICGLYQQGGGTNSWLGFPLSDEYSVQGGRRSDFEGGYIVWNSYSGETQAYTYGVAPNPKPANTPPSIRTFSHPHLPLNFNYHFVQMVTLWDAEQDPIVYVEVWDGDGTGGSGYWNHRDKPLGAGMAHRFTHEETRYLYFHAGQYSTRDPLWVRAYDGKDWSAWVEFSLTTKAK